MADLIRFVLTNLSAILLVAALLVATLARHPEGRAERYLAWLLLLAVGVDMVWAGVFHIFFPGVASAAIGWAPSPFEFEIGVADMAAGVIAIVSFWRPLDFKEAIAGYVILFYIGVAIGHVRQAVVAHDFAADNFGLLLVVTVVKTLLLAGLLIAAYRQRSRTA